MRCAPGGAAPYDRGARKKPRLGSAASIDRIEIEIRSACGCGRGFGFRFRFGFRGRFFALQVGIAAAALLDFIVLLSHISLLYGIDSVVYRDEYEELAVEHQRVFLRARVDLPFKRMQNDGGKEGGEKADAR
jgi:hypothetical protein